MKMKKIFIAITDNIINKKAIMKEDKEKKENHILIGIDLKLKLIQKYLKNLKVMN